MQKYPFQINTKILKLTAEISELVGSMSTLTEAADGSRAFAAVEKKQPNQDHLFLAGDRAEYSQLKSGYGGCIGQACIGAAEGHRRGAECL